ncbi:PREDICTED: syntenin-1 [Galeopterus variegatus]|uniref:Syntenin-1 n=1 Tax=Galeopterus variegatus TaxID=482537 RepID=A0ABM0QPT0_GALVR|nr:PREDICTED: syntenin-1 [Galeopterus variegatus]
MSRTESEQAAARPGAGSARGSERRPGQLWLWRLLRERNTGACPRIAQTAFSANPTNPAVLSEASAPVSQDGNLYPKLYPELSQYMGLSLNEEEICANMAIVPGAPIQGQLVARPNSMNYMVIPVTGNDVGICRAEIKQGIHEVILCKDQDGKIGLRLKSIDNDIFVQLVQANSPASLVGLRFGDQVLQINGENCAGWSSDKAHKVLKQAFGEKITMTVHDRPFERTTTMHKDSTGHVGFIFKNGKITSIVKDSSAARNVRQGLGPRNGLLTEHNICEVNGQNVIGLKDSQIADILSTSGTIVTITIMPAFIFEHIIKRMAPSIMKSLMDHTIPEI